jgi:hypothetical protein
MQIGQHEKRKSSGGRRSRARSFNGKSKKTETTASGNFLAVVSLSCFDMRFFLVAAAVTSRK